MTKEALQGTQKQSLKITAHAEEGYLVGYKSSNIYRIWVPSRSEVRRVRDMTFNERILYDLRDHPDPLRQLEPPQLQLPDYIKSDSETDLLDDKDVRSTIEVSPDDQSPHQSPGHSPVQSPDHSPDQSFEDPDVSDLAEDPSVETSQSKDQETSDFDEEGPYMTPRATSSPSSRTASPAVSPAASPAVSRDPSPQRPARRRRRRQEEIYRPASRSSQRQRGQDPPASFFTVFFNGREEKVHRQSLPLEPRIFRDLESHRFSPQFKEAANREMNSL